MLVTPTAVFAVESKMNSFRSMHTKRLVLRFKIPQKYRKEACLIGHDCPPKQRTVGAPISHIYFAHRMRYTGRCEVKSTVLFVVPADSVENIHF